MKKLIIATFALALSLTSNAQEKGKNTIEVKGNCEMCKKRIEKAALTVKGVRSIDWSADKQSMDLFINTKKTSVLEVEKAIAKAGHDTANVKATKEDYDNLHSCCQYER
ncbi:MAG: heavy-metal-associated domain-containing protein [Flavobacteriaceae bacterium]|jgi:copper chaperone CopZ|nr:heavy-metal-associated domain-containing protein [Flavobacteriaceae bacterium]